MGFVNVPILEPFILATILFAGASPARPKTNVMPGLRDSAGPARSDGNLYGRGVGNPLHSTAPSRFTMRTRAFIDRNLGLKRVLVIFSKIPMTTDDGMIMAPILRK